MELLDLPPIKTNFKPSSAATYMYVIIRFTLHNPKVLNNKLLDTICK